MGNESSTMSERRLRFTDTEFYASPRAYNQPNPCAGMGIPNMVEVLNTLTYERNNNSMYNNVWEEAQKLFIYKKKQLPSDYFKKTTADECYIAVIAYTMETDLYKDFNKRFRQLKSDLSWPSFPYKSFYYLLTIARFGIKNEPEIDRYLYRGMSNVHLNPAPKTGDYFYFDYFASCSDDKSVAQSFMGFDGTMIEMQDGAEVAMGITKYSQFNEGEVLVFPRNRFQVVKFESNGKKDRLVLKKAGIISYFV